MNKARRMRLPENSAYPKFHETHIEDAWCAQAGCIPVCPLPAEEFPIEVAPSRSAAPEPTIDEAVKLIKKIEACEGMPAKLILLRNFVGKSASAAPPSEREAATERLAKFIANNESFNCKTLDEAVHHQSKWKRIMPEAAAMLEAAYPAEARAAVPQAAACKFCVHGYAKDARIVTCPDCGAAAVPEPGREHKSNRTVILISTTKANAAELSQSVALQILLGWGVAR